MTDDERRAAAEVMAKGMVRSLYPQITDDEMHEPAKRWNGTALYDAEMSVLEDHIPEAERGILDLLAAGYRILPPGWPDDAAVERADSILRTLMVGTDNEPLDAMRAALLAAVGEG